jgi:ArsR family metal-binding transcriptional regulator
MNDALVESIALVRTMPCLAEPGKIIVVGRPDRPIAEVEPFLNALLPNVITYNPGAGVMTLRRKPGFITLYPDQVMITQVRNVQEGLELLAALRDLLNQVWERRETIAPRAAPRRQARPLDVYALLPGTNCRACGEATCMAFAFALIQSQRRPEECPSLSDPAFTAQYRALVEMVPPL